MTVVQKFNWVWPPGTTHIEFEDWIAALPNHEKEECLSGIQNQVKMRQEAIDRGDMIMTNEGYVWKDAETAQRGKGIDSVWEKYWLRWQEETGVIFSTTFEEE